MEVDFLLENAFLIWGLTEAVKRAFVPEKYREQFVPFLAVIIGAGTHVYLSRYTPEALMYGAALGLASTGLYDVWKNTFKKIA